MKQTVVERWGILELTLTGKTDGNPFTDCSIRGRFSGDREDVTVSGFYDGNGIWKIRFMPSSRHSWFCAGKASV